MSEIAKKAAAEIQAGIKNAVEKAIGQGELPQAELKGYEKRREK